MPVQFISHRERIEVVSFSRVFDNRDCPGSGFGFPCLEDGSFTNDNPAAVENRRKCLSGEYDVIDKGIRREVHAYWEPAVVRCRCGAHVVLEDSMSNCCERCGQWMNGSGQFLNDPSMWEPEHYSAVFGPQNTPDDY